MMSAARSPRRSTKRPLAEWALRGGLAALAGVLGVVSTMQTAAFAIRKSNIERAYALAPNDGRIAGELAEQIAAGTPLADQRARSTLLARQALIDEALAVPALTALALNVQLRGDTAAARKLFVHSDALSRRELGTRLWLIEDAVGRNDVAGALHHYDIALRTEKAAPALLFPILSEAISDPALAQALSTTIAARPPWSEAFIGYLAAVNKAPVVSSVFLRRLAERGVPISQAAQISMVNALVNSGKLEDGWAYYASFHKGVARDRSRDPEFVSSVETPAAFDWVPVANDTGISASIQSLAKGGVFDFAASSTVGGAVLQQTQLLPSGRYRLEGVSAGISQALGERPYWQLICTDGREIGHVEMPASDQNGGRFAGDMAVGADCPAQMLRLVIRPSSNIGGVSGQIERVQLVPAIQGR